MERTREEETAYPIWIDHTDKIMFFKGAEGFEQVDVSSQEERHSFAIEKCSSAYRIQ